MNPPNWVSRVEVEALHHGVIAIGGGAHGLRDDALLLSALARPENQHAYGETDRFQLAAGYAEAIARNHPFVDGNKRTAFMTAVIFLELNGYALQNTPGHEHADMMVALGQGHITRADAAAHLRRHANAIAYPASSKP